MELFKIIVGPLGALVCLVLAVLFLLQRDKKQSSEFSRQFKEERGYFEKQIKEQRESSEKRLTAQEDREEKRLDRQEKKYDDQFKLFYDMQKCTVKASTKQTEVLSVMMELVRSLGGKVERIKSAGTCIHPKK